MAIKNISFRKMIVHEILWPQKHQVITPTKKIAIPIFFHHVFLFGENKSFFSSTKSK
jgi:preprotein translocase subunit SecE